MRSPQTFMPPPSERFRQASSTRHRISNSIDAPLNAVMVPTSNGGATSTRSPPTKSMPRRARSSRSASSAVMPPASGVPVPGAWDGSRLSMSKRQIGRSVANNPPRFVRGEAPALVGEFVDAEHAHAARAGKPPHVRVVGGAADADLDHPPRVQQALLHRAAERRAVVEARAQVVVAGVAMGVDMHHADRPMPATPRRIGRLIE